MIRYLGQSKKFNDDNDDDDDDDDDNDEISSDSQVHNRSVFQP